MAKKKKVDAVIVVDPKEKNPEGKILKEVEEVLPSLKSLKILETKDDVTIYGVSIPFTGTLIVTSKGGCTFLNNVSIKTESKTLINTLVKA
jgi:hypothetical protein